MGIIMSLLVSLSFCSTVIGQRQCVYTSVNRADRAAIRHTSTKVIIRRMRRIVMLMVRQREASDTAGVRNPKPPLQRSIHVERDMECRNSLGLRLNGYGSAMLRAELRKNGWQRFSECPEQRFVK